MQDFGMNESLLVDPLLKKTKKQHNCINSFPLFTIKIKVFLYAPSHSTVTDSETPENTSPWRRYALQFDLLPSPRLPTPSRKGYLFLSLFGRLSDEEPVM